MSIIVLDYAGPPLWGSYAEIHPMLKKVWESLKIPSVKVWFPHPVIDPVDFKKIMEAQTLIFPIGIYHVDALLTLENFRKKGFKGRAVIMCSGAGLQGHLYLKSRVKALRTCDLLVVNSPREKKLLESQLGKALKIISIPLPVDEGTFSPPKLKQKTALMKELGLSPKHKYLIYAGRISAQKNLLSLFSVFAQFKSYDPNWKLLILGGVDDVGLPHMKNQNSLRYIHEIGFWIQKLDLGDDVQFCGHVSQDILARYMKASDALINLTLHNCEDFGYAVAQAISSSLPSIVTKWGGGDYFVSQGWAQGVTVHATSNGPRIAYDEALKQLLNLNNSSCKSADHAFSVKSVSRIWKSVLVNKQQESLPIKFSDSSVWRKSKLPLSFEESLGLEEHSIIYGAKRIKARSWYLHPQWLEKDKHLLDPISFVRNVSDLSDEMLKEYGILLPKLLKND